MLEGACGNEGSAFDKVTLDSQVSRVVIAYLRCAKYLRVNKCKESADC